jgi:hypothetical protein
MAYKPALGEGELHSTNFKSIQNWIKANKGNLKAPPNKTVLYSGLEFAPAEFMAKDEKKLPKEDRKLYVETPMYEYVAAWQKKANAAKDVKVGVGHKTLPDILKKLKPPVVVDKDRREVHYDNAWDFFDDLSKTRDLDALIPNRPKVAKSAWGELSEIFASNAEGDIKIFDGLANDYGRLAKDKDLIMREVPALLKNPKLSKKGRDELAEKFKAFATHFDHRYTELLRVLGEGRDTLKSGK